MATVPQQVCPSPLAPLSASLLLLLGLAHGGGAFPPPLPPAPPSPNSASAAPTCTTDFQALIQQQLRDLPAYANRAFIRTGHHEYLTLVSPPDFSPLSLSVAQALNLAVDPKTFHHHKQVFFTTLSHRYIEHQRHDLQAHHWAFFTQSHRSPSTPPPNDRQDQQPSSMATHPDVHHWQQSIRPHPGQ